MESTPHSSAAMRGCRRSDPARAEPDNRGAGRRAARAVATPLVIGREDVGRFPVGHGISQFREGLWRGIGHTGILGCGQGCP
jgi:hypothetical protein